MLVGIQNNTALLEDSLLDFYKPNIVLAYDPAIVLLVIYSIQWIHKNLLVNVFSSFIYDHRKLETRYPSVNEWTNCGTAIQWNSFSVEEK